MNGMEIGPEHNRTHTHTSFSHDVRTKGANKTKRRKNNENDRQIVNTQATVSNEMTVAFALLLIGTNRSERQTLRRRFDFYCLGYFCRSLDLVLAKRRKNCTKRHRTRLNAGKNAMPFRSKNIKYFNYSKWKRMGIYSIYIFRAQQCPSPLS